MKAAFSYTTITIVFLALSVVCHGQNNQPDLSPAGTDSLKTITADTLKKVNSTPGIAAPAKTDSLKSTKKKKRKKEQTDYVNPYQPNTPDGKPLPYNSYRETKKEPDKNQPGAAILQAILNNNKPHN